ncbi:hypothetical protein F4808DRAFT_465907 [Astrocystis sublimbata]|nr:hypothetical protein F4808DRAFT_465907 [Astrocystis sublimbata]
MPLELLEIDRKTDFPALARCMFESHEVPEQKFFQAFFPYGKGEQAREKAIAECATRLASWHEDPTSYWQKMVDTDTGRIAGTAFWNICERDPFEEKQKMEVTWYPDNGGRRFVEQFLDIFGKPRARVGRRPQVYLFILLTHPDYRRKGIAQTCLNWGMNKADEMGVDMFLDATPLGKPLYEANKFQVVEEYVIIPQTENPDDEWREAEEKIGHSSWSLMWRPVRGEYEEGVTVKPWEKK